MTDRPHHRPALPGGGLFHAVEAIRSDPAEVAAAAERAAAILVRGGANDGDPAIARRVVELAESEGIDAIAELWAHAPADSLAGALWRLYLVRTWVYRDPLGAARQFDRGRRLAPVAEAISGVVDPPGPDEVRALVDAVLRGVVTGEFADTLFRAAAFARVVALGRAEEAHAGGAADPGDLGTDVPAPPSAIRLHRLADQLLRAGHLELAGELG